MNGNGNNGNSALEAGLNLLSLLFGEEEKPKRPAAPGGARRPGTAGCNCTGRRVPPVRTPGKP